MSKRATRAVLAALATCAALPACNGKSGLSGAPSSSGGSSAPSTAATAPETPFSTGTLTGTVCLDPAARIPEPLLIENTTDPEVCGALQRARDLVVDVDSRGIANVIMALRNVDVAQGPAPHPAPAGPLVLDNRDCQFVPRAAVLRVGDTIEVVSHDAVLHTTHFYGALERNVALPNESATVTVTAAQPGMISVLCDVHGWMKAFIRVDAHPFHAVTDAEGRFALENIPTGTYELEAWHERLGSQSVSVRIEAEGSVTLDIDYTFDEG